MFLRAVTLPTRVLGSVWWYRKCPFHFPRGCLCSFPLELVEIHPPSHELLIAALLRKQPIPQYHHPVSRGQVLQLMGHQHPCDLQRAGGSRARQGNAEGGCHHPGVARQGRGAAGCTHESADLQE